MKADPMWGVVGTLLLFCTVVGLVVRRANASLDADREAARAKAPIVAERPTEWEQVATPPDLPRDLYRIRTEAGWLYVHYSGMAFVPDARK